MAFCENIYVAIFSACEITLRPKIKILLFLVMRVTRKIFTQAAANLFLLLFCCFFLQFILKELLEQQFSLLKNKESYLLLFKEKKNQFIPINLLVANRLNYEFQVFINHDFLRTRFRACKIVLGARPCTWEIVHIKEQTCTLLIIT